MNKIIILLIGVLIISCNQDKKENAKTDENSPTEISSTTDNFDWLIGKWRRTNEEEGKETLEYWKKKSDTLYEGMGGTLQNKKAINKEKFWLVKSNGTWSLKVKPQDVDEPIIFKMTSHTDQEFICENNSHDFPNKIKYWKNGDKINATVSNDETELLFEFEKFKKQKH